MAATIDDLDVVDLSDLDNGGEDNQQNGGEQTTPTGWTSEPGPDNGGEGSDDGDVITDVLKSKGIDDPSKIKIANDDGEIEEVDWNDLSREEQFAILKDGPRETERDEDDLDDDEIDLINRLRLSGMSPAEYAAMLHNQGERAATDKIMQSQQPHYTVDDLTDEELYVLDMQARVKDITEDELATALDRATSDPDLFAKEIAGIRNEYKKLEDDRNRQDAALEAQQQQEMYRQFAGGIANSIQDFTSIGDLDVAMSEDDMNELYTFITGHDQAGVNYMSKALNDPDTLVRMAWFALRGEDIINSISDYYKSQIAQAHRAGYEQGISKGTKKSTESKVVVKPKAKNTDKALSIDDLDV